MDLFKALGYRRGQWVLYGKEERIAILVFEDNRYNENGQLVVRKEYNAHLVAEDGTTCMVIPNIMPTAIRPAERQHIPASRLESASQSALDRRYPV